MIWLRIELSDRPRHSQSGSGHDANRIDLISRGSPNPVADTPIDQPRKCTLSLIRRKQLAVINQSFVLDRDRTGQYRSSSDYRARERASANLVDTSDQHLGSVGDLGFNRKIGKNSGSLGQ
jgi:hypothetical protein